MNRYFFRGLTLLVLLLCGCTTLAPRTKEKGTKSPTEGPLQSMRLVLEEFDGVHPNGNWDIHQYNGTFAYNVKPDKLVMIDKENRNQNLTRRGFRLDPKRRYAIEVVFTINEPPEAKPPNSFCLNFLVDGPENALDIIRCWAINLTAQPTLTPKGRTYFMGFINGKFSKIGGRDYDWTRTMVEYTLRVDMNSDMEGNYKFKTITVTCREADIVRERFEVDYAAYEFQPDFSKPVRFGVNSHGADWTMRNLKVFADHDPIMNEQ